MSLFGVPSDPLSGTLSDPLFGAPSEPPTTFGALLEVEMSKQVHATVARSTFRSQKCKTLTGLGPIFEVEMLKKWSPVVAPKHISKSKCTKRPHVRTTFRRSNVVSRGRRKGLRTWSKISKCEGFVAASTTIITLHYTPLHSITRHYSITRHHTTLPLHYIALHSLHHTMQLQLHYTNCATPQLPLHYTTATTTAAPHHTTSSSCGWGDRPGDHCNRCNHSK